MNGLRVYFNPAGAEAREGQPMFYSRRAGGPYYRWLYEETLGRWCCSRVHLPELTLRSLCLASWKVVPAALQTKLGEHYLE
ncbi:MAG TPA: hypothetical protein VF553_08410 [Pyrinomonadaceae bacterium]